MSQGQDKLAQWVLAWSKIMVTCWTNDQFRADLLKANPDKTRELFREMGCEVSDLMEVTVVSAVPEEVFRNPNHQHRMTDTWMQAKVKLVLTLPPPPPVGMRAMAVLNYLQAEADCSAPFCCC